MKKTRRWSIPFTLVDTTSQSCQKFVPQYRRLGIEATEYLLADLEQAWVRET